MLQSQAGNQGDPMSGTSGTDDGEQGRSSDSQTTSAPIRVLRDRLAASASKESDAVLSVLRASFDHEGSPLRVWFQQSEKRRQGLVDFLMSKHEDVGVKSYDELSAVEFVFRRLYTPESAERGLRQVNVRVSEEEILPASASASACGGMKWRMIKMGDAAGGSAQARADSTVFFKFVHGLMEALVEGSLPPFVCETLEPLVLSSLSSPLEHLVVIADPRTDPNEDDVTALAVLLAADRFVSPLFDALTVLVTGSEGSLDARVRDVQFLRDRCRQEIREKIAIRPAPLVNRVSGFAPYGDPEGASAHRLSGAMEGSEAFKRSEGRLLFEQLPPSFDGLFLIGAVDDAFIRQIAQREELAEQALQASFAGVVSERRQPRLKEVSIQGPGYNTMGTQMQDCLSLMRFCTEGQVVWCTNQSGLFVLPRQLEERFGLLERLDEGAGFKEYRLKAVTSFWATSLKAEFFQGQFPQYSYEQDTDKLLEHLETLDCLI
uniref:Uncharacterized protein n=1 Tax=Chromera velia CCMP2878 TaxID=1169474 RepID=A0A0G4GCS5_9ALVE|eukprot:Cvel_21342.t1-p1 / transcript=Cvel_21342.t1 / gene=Cvel_21342 / organism=Chromera_velia_CCMP2878 / gene_product=hypothetical protein / transcript_product=hypothetical protein / location=Cvel_scaffold1991:31325-32791(-) / protein_length=489 / sequence_SO=supercontig / SO=protein_coding / is_pseudo=false